MRHIALLLTLMPILAFGQKRKVGYSIDMIRIDSFYVVESQAIGDKQRPDQLKLFTLFRDTSDFREFLMQKVHERDIFTEQAKQATAQADSIDVGIKQLLKAAKQTFGIEPKAKNNR